MDPGCGTLSREQRGGPVGRAVRAHLSRGRFQDRAEVGSSRAGGQAGEETGEVAGGGVGGRGTARSRAGRGGGLQLDQAQSGHPTASL
jgi:hypothetical protein